MTMTEQEPVELEGVTFLPGLVPRGGDLVIADGETRGQIRSVAGGGAWDVDLPSGRTVRWMEHKAPGGAARWVLVDVSNPHREASKPKRETVGDLVKRYVTGDDLSVDELEQFHRLVRSGAVRLQVAVPAP